MIQLLVDKDEFSAKLYEDIKNAKKNAYVQTFSFEGDSTGKKLVRELEEAGIGDVPLTSRMGP